MTRYLKLSSLVVLFFAACSNPYKHLRTENGNVSSALRFKPSFDKELYRCVVDGKILLKKFHLSGLLFFKDMPDATTRVVFQNEMGFTFFDFTWTSNDSFYVNQVIPQLDKPALIKTLQKDLSLLMMKGLKTASEQVFTDGRENFHRFELEKGVAYYITDSGALTRIENAGKTKVTTIKLFGKEKETEMPEKIVFDHHKANFTIQLNKIKQDAEN